MLLLKLHKNHDGSSVVEFAIMVPLIALIIYFTLFLNDLSLYKLMASQVNRFAVFSVADQLNSDYVRSNPGTQVRTAIRETKEQVEQVFGDLDPTTLDDDQEETINAGLVSAEIQISYRSVSLLDEHMPYLPKQSLLDAGELVGFIDDSDDDQNSMSFILGQIEDFLEQVYTRTRFNTEGLVKADIGIEIKNRLMPSSMPGTNGVFTNLVPSSFKRGVDFKQPLVMLTDSWKLEDGRDLSPNYKTKPDNETGSGWEQLEYGNNRKPFHSQVKRLYMATLHPTRIVQDILGEDITAQIIATGISILFDLFLGDYISPRVSSKAYHDKNKFHDGQWDIYKESSSNPGNSNTVRWHHTAPFEDSIPSDSAEESNYKRMYELRGPYFLGCPTQEQGMCDHESGM